MGRDDGDVEPVVQGEGDVQPEKDEVRLTCGASKEREQGKRKTEHQEVKGSKRKKLDLIDDWGEHCKDEEEAGSIRN